MNKLRIIFILLAVFVLAFGCSKKEEKNEAQDEKPDPSRQELYVTINGEKITKGEFSDFISYSFAMMDPEHKDDKEVLKALKEDFIRHRLLLQEAKKNKIEIDEKGFAEMLASFKTDKGEKIVNEFEEELDIDFDKVKELMHQRTVVNQLLNGLTEDIAVSDKELADHFKKHKNELSGGKKAHILHIVTHEEQKAKEAMAMLKKGISFSEVAEKYSTAPEAESGGDLGYVDVSGFPDIFSEALKLKKGETSGLLKSDYGWHIFRLLDTKENDNVTFDDVKDELYDEVYGIKQENKIKEYTDELFKKAEIVFAGGSAGSSSVK